MLPPLYARGLASLAALLGVSLIAGSARAALPLIVETQELMDGIREHSEVTVKGNGVIRVKPRGAGGGLGFLHLRANRIVVEAGAIIDASGAGFQGQDGTNGDAPDGSSAAGKVPATIGEPGTGGGSVGAGGKGTTSGCSLFALAGGTAYTKPADLQFGASGGAARIADTSLASRGGHGGGRITLEAAIIEIHGVVAARGTDGINPMKVGSGGGGGGAIQIITGALSGGGVLSVSGGNGGPGAVSGGGGGGGVIVLVAPTSMPPSVKLETSGGASGSCGMIGQGDQGAVIEQPGEACPDVDGDGQTAAACGGTDCDDADAEIHLPGAGETLRERCDAQDNDCNGSADDDLPESACAAGYACVMGACVETGEVPDAGPDAAGPQPDRLDYAGGCRAHAAGSADDPGTGYGGLVLVGAAAAVLARRRPSRPARAARSPR